MDCAANADRLSGKGTEATMSLASTSLQFTPRRDSRQLNQLWQLPLLLVSLAFLTYAVWLFVTAKPGLTLASKVSQARTLLRNGRPEAAAEQVNLLLASER